MPTPSRRVLRSRESGRASPLLALFIALAICGSVCYYFLTRSRTPIVAPGPAPAAPASAPLPVTGENPRALQETTPPPSRDIAAPTPSVVEPTRASPTRRILGTGKDGAGHPIALALICWIPASQEDLRPYSHDPTLLGGDVDATQRPEPKLRDSLARSLKTSSDDMGGYELRVPAMGLAGVLVASSDEREMQLRDVAHGPADSTGDAPEALPAEELNRNESSTDIEMDFTLELAGKISGRVTEKVSGKPAPGMAVVATAFDADSPGFFAFRKLDAPSAVTNADGTYMLQGLRPGEYRVAPRTGKSEYAPLPLRLGVKVTLEAKTSLTDVDLQVSRGGRIFGHILGLDKKPVQGISCTVLPTDFTSTAMTEGMESITLLSEQNVSSDLEGSFEFRGLPPGKSYRVMAFGEGYAPSKSEPVEITDEQLEAEVLLSLRRGWSISGHAVFKDGRPAARVNVHILPDMGELASGNLASTMMMRGQEVTDESGAFTLRDLGVGTFNLQAGELKPQDFFNGTQKSTPVVIDGTVNVSGIRLIVAAEEVGDGGLAGVVVDDRGSPLAQASVQISSTADFTRTSASTITTEPDGSFSTTKLSGNDFQLAASKAGFANTILKGVTANTRNVRIVLSRNGSISGRIVTTDGSAPGAGGKVKTKLIEEKGSLVQNLQKLTILGETQNSGAAVKDDGTFSVEAPPGKVELLAMVPGFAPARSSPISVSPGEEHAGVEIRVFTGAVIQGRVTLGGNVGVAGATVTVQPATGDALDDLYAELLPQLLGKEDNGVVTDDEGYYEVLRLAAGEYALTARHPEYAPSDPVPVSLREDQVRKVPALLLTVGGRVSGRILQGNEPKSGVMVQMMGTGKVQQSTTDTDGQFLFKGLKPGEYLLNIIDVSGIQTGKMAMKTRSVILDGAEEKTLEVIFGAGQRIFGSIKGLPPAPLRMVTLRRPGGPAPEQSSPLDVKASVAAGKYQAGMAMVTPDDKYDIQDIEPGTYILEVAKLPNDPTDMAAYEKMDLTPHFRQEITLEKKDLEINIEIK